MTDAPERIYLQWSPEIDGTDQVTWCWDRIDDEDVPYVRADLAPVWHRMDDEQNPPPKDGTRFLAYEGSRDCKRYECWWQNDFTEWEGWQDDWDGEPEPTHWQPLTTPPSSLPAQDGGEE